MMLQQNYNRLISHSFLNELLVGVHRSFTIRDTCRLYRLGGQPGLTQPFGVNGWPTFCASNLGYYGYFCWDADNHSNQALTAEVLDDNATWTKGKHTIKFVGGWRLEQNNVRDYSRPKDRMTLTVAGRDSQPMIQTIPGGFWISRGMGLRTCFWAFPLLCETNSTGVISIFDKGK